MKPTLLDGDYIFTSKYSYGYSRYSFPLGLPVFDGRVMAETPVRGDVIVFRQPHNPSINYIKRLIGLPGDNIQMKDGILHINDVAVPKKRDGIFVDEDSYGNRKRVARFIETLPNGVSYTVLDEDTDGLYDNTQVYIVPEGHYFFMGDNRDNSADSRVLESVGYVPDENLVGKAQVILLSSSSSMLYFWKWFDTMRVDRFFSTDLSVK